MKTQKLKKETRYDTTEKNYTKSAMYEFDFSTDILVEEKKEDGSRDQTMLHYLLKEGDRAYFSEEYLPVGMKKDGAKKPDITAIIENLDSKEIKWFIYDMKGTVIKVKTAANLCS